MVTLEEVKNEYMTLEELKEVANNYLEDFINVNDKGKCLASLCAKDKFDFKSPDTGLEFVVEKNKTSRERILPVDSYYTNWLSGIISEMENNEDFSEYTEDSEKVKDLAARGFDFSEMEDDLNFLRDKLFFTGAELVEILDELIEKRDNENKQLGETSNE